MDLRRFLLDLPGEFQLDHRRTKQIRDALRDKLFSAATADGKYMSWLSDSGVPARDSAPTGWVPSQENHSHAGRPCVRKLRRGEPTYRCLTCGLDDTCVLCKYCFNPDDHVGHDVFVKITHREDGGICDCGDPEAWTAELHCLADQNGVPDFREVPEELETAMLSTFETVLDFCLDVLATAHSGIQFFTEADQVAANAAESELDPAVYGGMDPADDKYVLCLWNDERRSTLDAASSIKVATGRPRDFAHMVVRAVDDYGRGRLAVSADVPRLLLQKAALKFFTATIRSSRDYMREEMVDECLHWLLAMSEARLRDADPRVITNMVAKALASPWRVGNKFLNGPGANGPLPSGDIDYSRHSSKSEAAHPLFRHGLLDGVRVPRLEDEPVVPLPRPDSSAEEVDLKNMSFSALADFTSMPRGRSHESTGSSREPGPTLSPIWCNAEVPARPAGTDARAAYLIFYDIRLWKSLRTALNDLFVLAMVSHQAYKLLLGRIYAEVYPIVAEMYVMVDREPEVSVMSSLSTQLFTTPSIATEYMEGPQYTRYLGALYTMLDNGQVAAPQRITCDVTLSFNTPIFRNRRFGQLFHEIEFLLNRNTNKRCVVGNPLRVLRAADFLSLFQGLSTMKRQEHTHVEYESETWVFSFTTVPFAHQLAHAVARGAYELSFGEVRRSIAEVSGLLLKWAYKLLAERMSSTRLRQTFISCEYAGRKAQAMLSGVSVARDAVSLHHPVHVLLSWLIEYARPSSVEELREALFSGVNDLAQEHHLDVEFCRSLLFDSPLRAMTLLSQIHVGLWVRNGYMVRSQLHHYRETTLRDLAFTRDIFMAQTALVTLETNTAFIQLLNRWNMADWSRDPLFDHDQRYYMLEEFLHMVTYLLADRVHLLGLDEAQTRQKMFEREIVQCLAFHAMSFSEMSKYIPDAFMGDDAFELVLRRCAEFVPPKGVRDVGVYALKPELLAGFDAHYTHFSSARIEEAEQMIAKKIADATGQRPDDVIHVPPLEPLEGPWANLGAFTRSAAFARFMFDLFCNLLKTNTVPTGEPQEEPAVEPHVETVLDKALYLLLVAVKDQATNPPPPPSSPPLPRVVEKKAFGEEEQEEYDGDGMFPTIATWMTASVAGPFDKFVEILSYVLSRSNLSSVHPRVRRLLAVLHEQEPDLVPAVEGPAPTGEREVDRKKLLGKQMQAKALAELRKQQALFAAGAGADDAEELSDAMEDDDADSASDAEAVAPWEYPREQCVLCQMPDSGDSIFGVMTYIMPARTTRTQPSDPAWLGDGYSAKKSSLDMPVDLPDELTPAFEANQREDAAHTTGKAFPPNHTHASAVITGCGHGVHFSCYQEYIQTQRQRPGLTRVSPENVAKVEYLCTLCRGLNNAFMPVMWRPNGLAAPKFLAAPQDEQQAMQRMFAAGTSASSSGDLQGDLQAVMRVGLQELEPKFRDALAETKGFDFTFSHQTHAAIISSIIRLNDLHALNDDDAATGGPVAGILSAYSASVESMEASLRGLAHKSAFGGLLMDQLSPKNTQFLRVLTQYLRNLLGVAIKRELERAPASSATSRDGLAACPYEGAFTGAVDPFRRLVETLFFAAPVFDLNAKTAVQAFYVASIMQFFAWLRTVESLDAVSVDALPISDAALTLCSLWSKHNPQVVYMMLARHVTIYLRRAALVVFGLCGVYDADDFACMMAMPEHDRLAQYLGLQGLDDTLLAMSNSNTPSGWATQQLANAKFSGVPYAGVFKLIRLPKRLDAFFDGPDNAKLPADPAVCLFCGEVVSMQNHNMGKSRGPCNKHFETCVCQYGIFLLPKRNMLVYLLPDQRGSFAEAPYLDVHGEVDKHMRRGRPHFLQEARYDSIVRSIWLEHGLPSYVARKLDSTANLGGWETL